MSKYKQGDILSIIYDVWISGTKLDMTKKACIQSIDIKETVDGADTATIKLSDPKFLYIEDNIFIEENKIAIKMGWSNTTYRVSFNGYISAIDIEFGSNGIPIVTVTCMDNTHKMNKAKKSNTYSNTTSANVVKKIIAKYGYKCVIEKGYSFTVQETITQSDQTDIEFIQKLASDEVYPFSARLVGNTFYYVKKGNLTASKMILNYVKFPHEIMSFSPKINKESKKVEIKSSTVTTNTKKVSSTTGTSTTGSGSASSGSSSSGSSSSGSSSSGSTSNSKSSSSGSYTYDPSSSEWNKN